jgi:hypothetical protein
LKAEISFVNVFSLERREEKEEVESSLIIVRNFFIIFIMDAEEFRQRGREMVDFIADYLTTIRTRRVFPNVKPGYMRPMIADEAPRQGEPWDDIFKDIERVIMPGVGVSLIFVFFFYRFSSHRLHIGNHHICMLIFQH